MARIEIDKITKIDKSIREHEVVPATYSIANTRENDRVFQIDTYSASNQGEIIQTLQLSEDNLGKFMKLIASEFKSFTIPLLDDKGEVKYGINWGNRANRNINQAYLDLPVNIYNSDFFPINGNRFIIRTDDNQNLTFTRAQKDNVNGHALQTPEDNSIIGLYLRRRLSVKAGEVITRDAIEAYGRDYITISKIGQFYYLNFESLKTKKTSVTRIKKELSESLYRPYITAIKSKPFLLLAGISGTGKSRIVRELARACWEEDSEEYKAHKPKNFEMVQVKPNWHDSSELLGYVSRIGADKDGNGVTFVAGDFLKFIARAWEEQDVPFFLCLDEMNLAPVEQYFAEYLSVVESRKATGEGVVTDPILRKSIEPWYFNLCAELTSDDDLRQQFLNDGICIPQNLIVIGTVNMDETTFSFSRKVLDRAMTIEMNEVYLEGGLTERDEKIGKLGTDELIGTCVEGVDVYSSHKGVCDKVITYLKEVNNKLEGTPFKIAYRTRNEFLLYVVNNLPYNKDEDGEDIEQNYVIARALDEITNMKILSRIEGDETKVSEKFLKGLSDTIKEQLEMVFDGPFGIEETDDTYKSISLAKLDEMTKKLASGYTSFWS